MKSSSFQRFNHTPNYMVQNADNGPFVKLGGGEMRGSDLFALPVQAEHAKGVPDCLAVVVEVL
jgi:hypothetical protein